jgi:hypothetical protein
MGQSIHEQFWEGFNPTNMSKEHRNRLMGDVYGGYKQRSIPRYESRGAGSGRRNRQVGYEDITFHDYYNEGGWEQVGEHIGIKNVNSDDEIRRLYDYMHGYKPQAPKAAAPVQAAAAPKAATPAFDKRIAEIGKSYAAETSRLTNLMAQQQKDYDTRSTNQMNMFNQRSAEQQAAFDKYSASQDKKISNLSNSVANSASQYDPTKSMSTSNNINPALTIQEKGKDLSKGTQRYNRNSKLNITNVNV